MKKPFEIMALYFTADNRLTTTALRLENRKHANLK